jgi:hypothetical protein
MATRIRYEYISIPVVDRNDRSQPMFMFNFSNVNRNLPRFQLDLSAIGGCVGVGGVVMRKGESKSEGRVIIVRV